jgi:hypothetical protein
MNDPLKQTPDCELNRNSLAYVRRLEADNEELRAALIAIWHILERPDAPSSGKNKPPTNKSAEQPLMALVNCSCGGWYAHTPEQKNAMQHLIDQHQKRCFALIHAKTKLQQYRMARGDQHVGGMEYTHLIALIDEAMK